MILTVLEKPEVVKEDNKVYEEIRKYMFYESGKMWVKVRVELPGLNLLPKESIIVDFLFCKNTTLMCRYKIFSLFIQSVGMTFATLFFISRRIPIYWRWLALLLPSSMLGLWVGFTYLQASSHHTKLLLSIIVLIAGISLLKTHFSVRDPDSAHRVPYWVFFVLGFPGGVLSSLVGTGADTLFFFVLVIIFHKNAKVIIPTSVAYMASCSLIGTSMIITSPAMQVTPFVLNSWMIAAPVVAIGAPLGGYAMSKANPGYLLIFIKVIIILEAVSTFVLVELGVFEKVVLGCAILGAAGYLLLKLKLLVRRPLVC